MPMYRSMAPFPLWSLECRMLSLGWYGSHGRRPKASRYCAGFADCTTLGVFWSVQGNRAKVGVRNLHPLREALKRKYHLGARPCLPTRFALVSKAGLRDGISTISGGGWRLTSPRPAAICFGMERRPTGLTQRAYPLKQSRAKA